MITPRASATMGAGSSVLVRRRIFIGIGVLALIYLALMSPSSVFTRGIFGPPSSGGSDGNGNKNNPHPNDSIAGEHITPGGFYSNHQNQALMRASTQTAMEDQQRQQIAAAHQHQPPLSQASDPQQHQQQQQYQQQQQQPPPRNQAPPATGETQRKEEETTNGNNGEKMIQSGDWTAGEEQALEQELLEEEKVEEAAEEDLSEEQKSHRLECRDSVMEFVINASDQKDECDGLRRAFDNACTNLDMAESIFNPAAASQNVVVHAPGYNPKLDHINPNLLPGAEAQPGQGQGQGRPQHPQSRSEDVWGPGSRGPTRRGGGDGDGDGAWDVRWDSTEADDDEPRSSMGEKLSQSVKHDTAHWGVVNWLTDNLQRTNDNSKSSSDNLYYKSLDDASVDEGDDAVSTRRGHDNNRRNLQISPAIPSNQEHPGNLIQQGGGGGGEGAGQQQQNPAQQNLGAQQRNQNKNQQNQNNQQRPFVPRSHPSQLYSHAQSILESPESIEARTCCASILNVFHEHCDRNEEVEYTDRSLFVIVCVVALCGIVKSLIRYYELRWLPEAGGCILVGGTLRYVSDYRSSHILCFLLSFAPSHTTLPPPPPYSISIH
jgi:hypothetical protein